MKIPAPTQVPADRKRIDFSNADETVFWTRDFGCSLDQLHQAVTRVGNSSETVRRYLANRWKT